jgi:Arc/MetJ-type ribon-helix-helix transcriptional regulator
MKTLTVKVPEQLLADIETAAKGRKVSRSEIIRERLEFGAGRTSGSLWNRMEDLLIDDDSLPRDLSSNNRHLENYGKNRSD